MVDIRIMAHPSRADNVSKILEALSLPEDIVTWDDRPGKADAMYTARKAWTVSVPDGCTHRLVIQDDAEVCDNFLEIVEKVASRYPWSIVSLFHVGKIFELGRYHACDTLPGGVAVMIPVAMLDHFWNFVDNTLSEMLVHKDYKVFESDTTCIRHWMRCYSIPCVTTVPSLVQHLGNKSLVGIKRIRVAEDYTKTPPVTGW